MRMVIFGAAGFLGKRFTDRYPEAVTPKVDIADAKAVAECLDREKPDVVINCAGKTGRPNVDWCEDHKDETVHSNVIGPLVLQEACATRGIYWVHLSSGCIYEGDNGGRGFAESDPPNFSGSFYSRTKSWSDQILKEFPVLQLRIRMPFDGSTDPRNLLMKLRAYSRVLDVQNSITHLPDAVDAAVQLIEKRVTGTFNIVNPGTMSPFDVMLRYKEIVDPSHTFEKLTLEDLPSVTRAARSNCTLSVEKLTQNGIDLPPVSEAMDAALLELKTAI